MANNHFFMTDEEVFFYMNTSSEVSPIWSLMNYAEEVNIDMTKAEIDLPISISKFKLTRGGDFDCPLSFKYSRPKPDITDPLFNKLWDSFVNHDPIQFAFTDLPIADTDAIGIKMYCEITKFPFKKINDQTQMFDIEAKPTDYEETGVLILPAFIGAPAP